MKQITNKEYEEFQVETVKTYAADYYDCIDDAKAELRSDARPFHGKEGIPCHDT